MVVGSTRREGGAGDALTSALLLKYTSEAPLRGNDAFFIDLVARLQFLFVRLCAARSSAQVTWTRGRGPPTHPLEREKPRERESRDHDRDGHIASFFCTAAAGY